MSAATDFDYDPIACFNRLLPDCRLPQRADRSAAGTLPTRAFRYCEAITSASAFGWYFFPPLGFSLLWDGFDVMWKYEGEETWLSLRSAQFPGYSELFDAVAPDDVKTFSPPFLSALREPGVVQVWSGFTARTAPGWSLLLRPLPNVPRSGKYELYEGIVETDRWPGPLFTNLRLTQTDVPVEFHKDFPLLVAQPLQRSTYADDVLNDFRVVDGIDQFTPREWDDYRRTVVCPNADPERGRGQYATSVRQRRKGAELAPASS
jgi:hypothetical protein